MKPIFRQKAQVSLETTALAVLAMTALLAMGTYAVRSINAYFKLSEDTVEDSQSETMLQAPWGDETPCFCDLPEEGVCGEEPCNPWQKKFAYICNAECVNPPEFICVDARADCCEAQELGCAESGCGNRERAWDISCDGEEPLIECRYDPECRFSCQPEELQYFAEWCKVNGSPVGPAPEELTGHLPVTYVEDGPPDACTGALCEVICKDPLVPLENGEVVERGSACDCPPDYILDQDPLGAYYCRFIRQCWPRGIMHRESDQRKTCRSFERNFVMDNYCCNWDNNYCRRNNILCCSLGDHIEVNDDGCEWIGGYGKNGDQDADQCLSYAAPHVMAGINYTHDNAETIRYWTYCCPLVTDDPAFSIALNDCQWTETLGTCSTRNLDTTGCNEFGEDYVVVGLDTSDLPGAWLQRGRRVRLRCCRVDLINN